MSTIIAIETSTEIASVALLHRDQLLWREISGAQTHSQTVLPMMQGLLAEAGIAFSQCDAVAFGAGPGSFTGVRTACGIAQGVAFGLDLPVLPVGTLHAMAHACKEIYGATEVLSVLDARMGEVYWAQYRFAEQWQTVIEPRLSDAASIAPVGHVQACGNGLAAYPQILHDPSFAEPAYKDVVPHAKQVAQLGLVDFKNGGGIAARDVQPIYLRNKVALTTSERMAKANS